MYLDEFTDIERLEIVKGIMMWERATRGSVSWHVVLYVDDESLLSNRSKHAQSLFVLFKKASSGEAWISKWDSESKKGELLGVMLGNPRQIAVVKLVMDRLETPNSLSVVSAHELGHVMGLNHVVDSRSVMNATVNRSLVSMSKIDLNEFYAKHPETLPAVPVSR